MTRLLLTMLFMLAGAPAYAATIDWTYDANVLPTADGWTFGDNPGYEAGHVYVESPGVIRVDDLDTFVGSATWYRRAFTNSGDPLYAGEITTQVVAGGTGSSYFLVRDGTSAVSVQFFDGSIRISGSGPATVVATNTNDTFHTYRTELSGGNFNVLRDGVLLHSGVAAPNAIPAEINFGMNSSALTGQIRVDQVTAFSGTAVPEPGTWLLLLVSGTLLGGLRRAS
jgi:hypothetical protein